MNKQFANEKRQYYIKFILIVGIIISVVLLISTLTSKEKKPVAKPIKIIDDKKAYDESFKAGFGQNLSDIDRKVNKLETDNLKLNKDNEAMKKEIDALRKGNGVKTFPQDNAVNSIYVAPTPPTETTFFPAPEKKDEPYSELQPPQYKQGQYNYEQIQPKAVLLTNLIKTGSSPKVEEKIEQETVKQNLIPTGSFVKATLLSGVMAPTMGKGITDPVPVLMKITDIAVMPNFFKFDIKDCFVIGDAKGNLASEMANIRLTTLSCVDSKGNSHVKKINGYVSGETGVEGLTGRVVSKQATLLGRALIAAFVDGVAQAFKQSSTGYTVTPGSGFLQNKQSTGDALESALFAGAGAATSKLADQYIQLIDETVPVIEINPGRNVNLVFLSDIIFERPK